MYLSLDNDICIYLLQTCFCSLRQWLGYETTFAETKLWCFCQQTDREPACWNPKRSSGGVLAWLEDGLVWRLNRFCTHKPRCPSSHLTPSPDLRLKMHLYLQVMKINSEVIALLTKLDKWLRSAIKCEVTAAFFSKILLISSSGCSL